MGPHQQPAPVRQHEPLPVKDSARSTGGTNKGKPADLRNPEHYPLEAECVCGRLITAESFYFGFYHTSAVTVGREPGEPR